MRLLKRVFISGPVPTPIYRKLRMNLVNLKLWALRTVAPNTMAELQRFRERQPAPQSRVLLHRSPRLAGEVGEVIENAKPDRQLTKRAIQAFQLGNPNVGNSIWLNEFARDKRTCVKTLVEGDVSAIEAMLTDPASSLLFYGFDNIHSSDVPQNRLEWWRNWMHMLAYDSLLQLAKAVGAIRVENPEPGVHHDESPDPEYLISQLDDVFGFKIDFPNLFRGEIGLQTSRGVASYRAVQALYQAWRITTVAPDGRICEIGGGLGRTAYYCCKMGSRSYCIIDLPLTGISQASFLGRLMPITLHGERPGSVHLGPPESYGGDDCDLTVNFDSLTEMDRATAVSYLVNARSPRFLSINHEANEFTVRDLVLRKVVHRSPCWLREGYVEELITI